MMVDRLSDILGIIIMGKKTILFFYSIKFVPNLIGLHKIVPFLM